MQAPYIPASDAAFRVWIVNFAALITAAPANYGLIAGDAVTIQASANAFDAAYILATDPSTRTAPTIAAKDAARASATATVRPYAIGIKLNAAVSDENKTAVGVNVPVSTRTPIPPPATAPALTVTGIGPGVHTLAYRDVTTPASKAKPFGAIGIELFRTVAAVETYLGTRTKSPAAVDTVGIAIGTVATYRARWITRSGPAGSAQTGPWSAPVSAVVA
jgi:hypothetical protein